MPVMIGDMTSTFEIRDEAKIRKLVREEIKAAMAEEKRRAASSCGQGNAADAAASGRPGG
jgi:hypothetical protein